MEDKNKITYKDLSLELKIPIIFIYIYLTLMIIGFILGVFVGILEMA